MVGLLTVRVYLWWLVNGGSAPFMSRLLFRESSD